MQNKSQNVVNGKNGLVCAFCGAIKNTVTFVIGAQSSNHTPDWCMIYGTGKMACPACYEKAAKEGAAVVDAHVSGYNGRKIYTYADDFKEYIAASDRGEICQIDEEMFYYFLEVLPPQYMNRDREIDGHGIIRCSFGFAEGAGHIIDFWRGRVLNGGFYSKRSNRMASLR